jgi:hypothetical protein
MGEIPQEHIQSFVALSERSTDQHTNTPCPLCPEVRPLMDLEGHLAEHLESIALFVLGAEFDANQNEGSATSGSSSQLWSHSSEFLRGSQGPQSIFGGRLSDIGDDQTLPVEHHRASTDIRRYARPFLNLLRRQSSTAPAEAETKAGLQRRTSFESIVERDLDIPIGDTEVAENSTGGTDVQMKAESQIQRWFDNGMRETFKIPSGYVTVAESIDAETKPWMREDSKIQMWFENGMRRAFKIPSGYITIAVLVIRWDDAIDDYKEGRNREVWLSGVVRAIERITYVFRLPSSSSSSSAILATNTTKCDCGHQLQRNLSTISMPRSRTMSKSMIVPTVSSLSTILVMDFFVVRATTEYWNSQRKLSRDLELQFRIDKSSS